MTGEGRVAAASGSMSVFTATSLSPLAGASTVTLALTQGKSLTLVIYVIGILMNSPTTRGTSGDTSWTSDLHLVVFVTVTDVALLYFR